MEFYCNICEKKYKNYKSLWKHNYTFHKHQPTKNTPEVTPTEHQKTPKNIIKCNNCNLPFSRTDSLSRHIKKNRCKKIIENIKDDKDIKIEKMAKEMEKLKELLQKALKIHPKTLQKINNQLNNNSVNTINNNVYVQLGREDLIKVLSNKQKMGILNRKAMGINDLVELIHTSGKYKQFMNIYITNLQNTVAYCYNEKLNTFIAVNKNELLNDLIDCRMYDIQKFFDEAQDILDPNTSADIKRIIKKMEDDETFKGIKKDEIKFILYNNKDKIILEKEKLDKEKELEI